MICYTHKYNYQSITQNRLLYQCKVKSLKYKDHEFGHTLTGNIALSFPGLSTRVTKLVAASSGYIYGVYGYMRLINKGIFAEVIPLVTNARQPHRQSHLYHLLDKAWCSNRGQR